ncbi:hypothetical protein B0H34DRAFT_506678 [Crassisporium funariophilum]|nr:hypothetical protein B0H34DRAFT_506678 [Crassisporium funariophilum]
MLCRAVLFHQTPNDDQPKFHGYISFRLPSKPEQQGPSTNRTHLVSYLLRNGVVCILYLVCTEMGQCNVTPHRRQGYPVLEPAPVAKRKVLFCRHGYWPMLHHTTSINYPAFADREYCGADSIHSVLSLRNGVVFCCILSSPSCMHGKKLTNVMYTTLPISLPCCIRFEYCGHADSTQHFPFPSRKRGCIQSTEIGN